jgi:hypothetical protein
MAVKDADFKQLSDKIRQLENDIRLLSKEVQHLKTAQDETASQHAGQILTLQKMQTRNEMNSYVNVFSNIIATQLRNNTLYNQLLADAAFTKSEISKSKVPFNLADQFFKKWTDILKRSGAKMTES